MQNNILLRTWELSDADSLTIHANNSKVASNLREAFPHPYNNKNALDFINLALKEEFDLKY